MHMSVAFTWNAFSLPSGARRRELDGDSLLSHRPNANRSLTADFSFDRFHVLERKLQHAKGAWQIAQAEA